MIERFWKHRKDYAILIRLPFIIFFILICILIDIIYKNTVIPESISEIPSVLVGQKAPDLDISNLDGFLQPLNVNIIENQLTLVNIFSSWCLSCRQEHTTLMRLSKEGHFFLVGINYKDRKEDALSFLKELGNPYNAIAIDPNGKVAINWGVYGIPESYLIGPDGIILYKRLER